MDLMLGCLLYLITDFNLWQDILSDCGSMLFDSKICSADTIFENKSIKLLATSFCLSTILLLSFKVIETADFVLSKKRGFTVFQNFLMSVMSFASRLL